VSVKDAGHLTCLPASIEVLGLRALAEFLA
jgi:hypothetical protein